MAEEEEQESTDGQEGVPQQGGEEQPAKGKKILIIAIAGILLFIAITAALLFTIFFKEESEGVKGYPEEQEYVAQYNQRMQTSLEPVTEPLFSEPFSYSVNLKNGRNYIHVTLRAVLKDPMAKTYLEERSPEIDDKIITLLKSKNPDDLNTRTGLALLKQEFHIEFNQMFSQRFIEQSQTKDRTPVKEILVNEFYVQ